VRWRIDPDVLTVHDFKDMLSIDRGAEGYLTFDQFCNDAPKVKKQDSTLDKVMELMKKRKENG
jgi:hypothetical protein